MQWVPTVAGIAGLIFGLVAFVRGWRAERRAKLALEERDVEWLWSYDGETSDELVLTNVGVDDARGVTVIARSTAQGVPASSLELPPDVVVGEGRQVRLDLLDSLEVLRAKGATIAETTNLHVRIVWRSKLGQPDRMSFTLTVPIHRRR